MGTKKIFKNKNLLILGSGPKLKQNKNKIEKFIKRKKPIVLAINDNPFIDKKLINFRVISHTMRILLESNNFKKSKIPLITPYSKFSQRIKKVLERSIVLDFGLQVRKNTFEFKKKNCLAPNSLALSYSLGIANSGEVKSIVLAGFDGYKNNMYKNDEMVNLLRTYKKTKNSIKLSFITKSLYKY